MAGTSTKSEKFEMRVPVGELADWRRRAAALSLSVAELVRLKMRQPDAPAAPVDPSPKPIDLDALEREWRRKWEANRSKAAAPTFSHGRGKPATDERPTDFPKVDGSFFKPKQKVALEKIGKGKP